MVTGSEVTTKKEIIKTDSHVIPQSLNLQLIDNPFQKQAHVVMLGEFSMDGV